MIGPQSVDSHPRVAYLTEAAPGTAALRPAAAVVLRGLPTSAAVRGGGRPLGWFRRVRLRLWLRFGPLGFDVSVAGRPLFGGTWGAPRSVSSVGAGPSGEPLAYYDDDARVLRVLGRVVPAPSEGTFVALVDATGPRAATPRVVLRVVPTPEIPLSLPAEFPLDGAAVVSHFIGGEQPVWEAALRADRVVRSFLDSDGTS